MDKFVKTKDGNTGAIMHWTESKPYGWYVEIWDKDDEPLDDAFFDYKKDAVAWAMNWGKK